MLIEVLDARDPLGCRCLDVERFVRKLDPSKKIVLLLNKIGAHPRLLCLLWLLHLLRLPWLWSWRRRPAAAALGPPDGADWAGATAPSLLPPPCLPPVGRCGLRRGLAEVLLLLPLRPPSRADLVPREVVEQWIKYFREELPSVAFKCSTQKQVQPWVGPPGWLLGWLLEQRPAAAAARRQTCPAAACRAGL